MGFFKIAKVEAASTTFEISSGSQEPIPAGTRLIAIVAGVEWKDPTNFNPHPSLALKWKIVQDGPYKGRTVMQKLHLRDPAKQEKAEMMLLAIDKNAGGRIAAMEEDDPPAEKLAAALANRPMAIDLDIWESETDKTKRGNWVRAVGGRSAAKPAAPAPEATVAAVESDEPPF